MGPVKILIAFHLLGVVLWMGGLLTLSRLLGYHVLEHPSVRPRYAWLEARLNYAVAIPGAFLTLGTGVTQMALDGADYFRSARWLHIKLGLVAAIALVHILLTVKQMRIRRGPADAPLRRAPFAAAHGTLGLLLMGALLLAVLKQP